MGSIQILPTTLVEIGEWSMSAPDPSVIRKLTKAAENHLSQLRTDYAFLFPSGYSVSRTGGGDKIVTKNRSDTSSLMTGDVSRFCSHIEATAKSIFEAERLIMVARNNLASASNLLDKRVTVEPAIEERALPHPADQGDLRRAQQAQKRRRERMLTAKLPWSAEEVTG